MQVQVDLKTIIWNSLNLTDSTANFVESYYSILEDLWANVDGVKYIVQDDVISNQINIVCEDDKIDELYNKIKTQGWTVHRGKDDMSNHLFILWGVYP
jgi:hypothetical protein